MLCSGPKGWTVHAVVEVLPICSDCEDRVLHPTAGLLLTRLSHERNESDAYVYDIIAIPRDFKIG